MHVYTKPITNIVAAISSTKPTASSSGRFSLTCKSFWDGSTGVTRQKDPLISFRRLYQYPFTLEALLYFWLARSGGTAFADCLMPPVTQVTEISDMWQWQWQNNDSQGCIGYGTIHGKRQLLEVFFFFLFPNSFLPSDCSTTRPGSASLSPHERRRISLQMQSRLCSPLLHNDGYPWRHNFPACGFLSSSI